MASTSRAIRDELVAVWSALDSKPVSAAKSAVGKVGVSKVGVGKRAQRRERGRQQAEITRRVAQAACRSFPREASIVVPPLAQSPFAIVAPTAVEAQSDRVVTAPRAPVNPRVRALLAPPAPVEVVVPSAPAPAFQLPAPELPATEPEPNVIDFAEAARRRGRLRSAERRDIAAGLVIGILILGALAVSGRFGKAPPTDTTALPPPRTTASPTPPAVDAQPALPPLPKLGELPSLDGPAPASPPPARHASLPPAVAEPPVAEAPSPAPTKQQAMRPRQRPAQPIAPEPVIAAPAPVPPPAGEPAPAPVPAPLAAPRRETTVAALPALPTPLPQVAPPAVPPTPVAPVSPAPDTSASPRDPADFFPRLVAAALDQTRIEGTYDHRYVRIAYPMGDVPETSGVCSDVIVRAYRRLGIDLQQHVHEAKLGTGDASVDHRRVMVLKKFFEKFGTSLKPSPFPEAYKPGDIVAYDVPWGRTSKWHIAIVTDRLSPSLRPMVVHNRGYGAKLEDALFHKRIIGHYRFDGATLVEQAATKAAQVRAAEAAAATKTIALKPSPRLLARAAPRAQGL